MKHTTFLLFLLIKFSLAFLFLFGSVWGPGSVAQGLLFALDSRITPGRLGKPYGVLGTNLDWPLARQVPYSLSRRALSLVILCYIEIMWCYLYMSMFFLHDFSSLNAYGEECSVKPQMIAGSSESEAVLTFLFYVISYIVRGRQNPSSLVFLQFWNIKLNLHLFLSF